MQTKAVFVVVADCDLYIGRNIPAKGPPLTEGAGGTAVSSEHLHGTGSEQGVEHLRDSGAAHRHLASKYRHSTVQIPVGQTKLTGRQTDQPQK